MNMINIHPDNLVVKYESKIGLPLTTDIGVSGQQMPLKSIGNKLNKLVQASQSFVFG